MIKNAGVCVDRALCLRLRQRIRANGSLSPTLPNRSDLALDTAAYPPPPPDPALAILNLLPAPYPLPPCNTLRERKQAKKAGAKATAAPKDPSSSVPTDAAEAYDGNPLGGDLAGGDDDDGGASPERSGGGGDGGRSKKGDAEKMGNSNANTRLG